MNRTVVVLGICIVGAPAAGGERIAIDIRPRIYFSGGSWEYRICNSVTIVNASAETVVIWMEKRNGSRRTIEPFPDPETGRALHLAPRQQKTITRHNIAQRDTVFQLIAAVGKTVIAQKEIYWYGSYQSSETFVVSRPTVGR